MRSFDKAGPENTDECVRLAYERAKALGLKEVIVATNRGDTVRKVLDVFEGFTVIAVNHRAGFREPWKVELPDDARKELEDRGAKVVIATHAFSGIELAFKNEYQGMYPGPLAADVLRMFGQGTKVCVEIALMAADAGVLSGDTVMTIGGTGTGADTAIVLTPVHQKDFLDMRIHEIVCKPK
ncbi:MAG: hypothetical protein AYK23_02830 [Candidatus Proteinoplasmatales archaeon SG8-5]|nr:MAG: hypothetical protein AYK23_02830 [Candidatus Proteinoplasmatales archaeon SG8-5]